mmetsp:Transcript_13502/g.13570  ORF Transcript_13502/g.13570 Transcript_13502/m.13570 type:complete len:177 (-) Transcript_13502:165-695(-)
MSGSGDATKQISLFLHILFAMIYVGGLMTASILRFYAAYSSTLEVSQIATLLSLIRPLVPIVVVSFLVAVGLGFWVVSDHKVDIGSEWLAVTYALVVWNLVIGIVNGRHDRHTRELAVELSRDGGDGGKIIILKARLKHPLSLFLNLSMLLATIVILAMMVFQPITSSGDTAHHDD